MKDSCIFIYEKLTNHSLAHKKKKTNYSLISDLYVYMIFGKAFWIDSYILKL